jgi:hypothetical protein
VAESASPQPVKLGPRITAWRVEDVRALIEEAELVMSAPDFLQTARAALASPQLIPKLLPNGRRQGSEWLALNPRRVDSSVGTFKVNLRTGRRADFATGDKNGDLISLVAYLRGVSQSDAARILARELRTGHSPHPRSAPRCARGCKLREYRLHGCSGT